MTGQVNHPDATTPIADHSVTRRNTVKHWVLYTLDAIEAEGAARALPDVLVPHYPRDDDPAENQVRFMGVYPELVYEYAAGKDSIVFKDSDEIAQALSAMARLAPFYENESRPVNRRTEETEWDGHDVKYRYRLTDFGRGVLLDLGRPDKLPNRRDLSEDERSLGVRPAHEPGWWQPEYELFEDEWDIRDNDWIATKHDRVFIKDEGAEALDRGYKAIGAKLADRFEDVTFVLTIGPHRFHDMAYAIRDPWHKVVQIDIYSPMAWHRKHEEITANFEALVRDLDKGLESVTEEYVDD